MRESVVEESAGSAAADRFGARHEKSLSQVSRGVRLPIVVSWVVSQAVQVAQLAMPAVVVVLGRSSSVEGSLLPSLARESDPLTGLRTASDVYMCSHGGRRPEQRQDDTD